ncbi:MFS transporter [Leucobacter sp. wl10]|nr:MFS transporter [Leucobacter sp. wl10]
MYRRTHRPAESRRRPALGVVLASLCLTEIVSWGLLYYTFPVVAPHISSGTGWSPTVVTAAFSLALVVSAFLGVPVGRLIDRHGPRWVMTTGSVLATLALGVVASAQTLSIFYIGWVMAGAAMAGVLYPPAFAAITGWFSTRGLNALTTLTLVAGLASTVFAPLAATMSTSLGWRATYLWAAVILAAFTIPLHGVLLRRPWPVQEHARSKDHGAERAYTSTVIKTRRFWLLSAGMTLASITMYATLLATVPLMLERGLTSQTAAWILGLGGVGQVAGRLFYAVFARWASLAVRTALVFGIVTISTAALAFVPGPTPYLIAMSMMAGIGRGIATLLQATAVTERWGHRAYGHLSAAFSLPVLLAAAIAPWGGSILALVTGSYAMGFGVLSAVAAIGTVLVVVSAREPRSKCAQGVSSTESKENRFRRPG